MELVNAVRIVVILVANLCGNLLQLLFVETSVGDSTQLIDCNSLNVTTVYDVVKVWVFRIAVYKSRWIDIVNLDTVVGIVATLRYSHAQARQVVDATSVRVVVEVIPRQGEVGSNLCCHLRVRLDVCTHEYFSFLQSLRDLLWLHPKHHTRLLLQLDKLLPRLNLQLDNLLSLVLLRRGQRIDCFKIWIGISRQDFVYHHPIKLREYWNRGIIQIYKAAVVAVWIKGMQKLLVNRSVLRSVSIVSTTLKHHIPTAEERVG